MTTPDKTPETPALTAPDLTSVRTLITSVTKLAKALECSVYAVYQWIKLNRIPGKRVVKIANYYNVELSELLHLTGSTASRTSRAITKPKNTLATLIEVYRGAKTLEDACSELGIPLISGRLIMTHWGDELPTLFTTLTQLDEKRISLETAMQRLGVTKYTLHGIRSKYGFAPGRVKRTRPVSQIKERTEAQDQAALRVIAGLMTTKEAMAATESSYRSIFRFVERLTDVGLNDLSAWPLSFRAAFAVELERERDYRPEDGAKPARYVQKWLKFATEQRLFLSKTTKYPKTPDSWKSLPLKRLLVAVLVGEATLSEVAASRGAGEGILRGLFTSDLRVIDLTFDEVEAMSIQHQTALAELILAVMDRRRRYVEGAK